MQEQRAETRRQEKSVKMIKLMKSELERMNLRGYLLSAFLMGCFMLAFTYFVAYVARQEQETQFMTYENIFLFTGAISILLFGILSAVMYSRLIIEEYSGKRLALLFSYPGSRKRIFMAKVLIVFLFVLVSMVLCTLIPSSIFAVTESFSPIVSDKMTPGLLTSVFKMSFLSVLAVSAIGLLSLLIGFRKKSIAATLVSSFILSCLYGNISVTSAGSPSLFLLIAGFSAGIIFMVLFSLINKIEHMEVL